MGVSSLAVTLPKAWTDSMGVHLGDSVRFRDTGQGFLEITLERDDLPSTDEQRPLTIVASDAPMSLVSRLMKGAYVSGQDHITITARKGFSDLQREEIHRAVTQIPGFTVVADQPGMMTLQVSGDLMKRRASGLIDHMTQLVMHEMSLCRRALAQQSSILLAPMDSIEDDLGRTYLLLARELLCSVGDARVAQKIGVEGPQLKLSYRQVANALAAVGEQVSAMAHYLHACMRSTRFSAASCATLGDKVAGAEELLTLTMQAFNQVSASEANLALTMIAAAHEDLDVLMVAQTEGKRCSVLKQRIASKLITTGELLQIINRETLSCSVEPGTVARSDGRVVVAGTAEG